MKLYKLKGTEIVCCKCSEIGMVLKEITGGDCFRLDKEQPYKSKPLVFYVASLTYSSVNEKAKEFEYVYQGVNELCGLSERKENSQI